MTSRQQRRAAERIARKQATRTAASPLPSAQSPSPQLDAGHFAFIADASPALLFPGEAPDAYRAHLHHYFQLHQPAPGVESYIVKRLADLQWRLLRMSVLEAGIIALGRIKYAELFAEILPERRQILIDAYTLSADAAILKNLHLQESRLRRYFQSDLAELAKWQAARLQNATASPAAISEPSSAHAAPLLPPDDDGFEFSFLRDLEQLGLSPAEIAAVASPSGASAGLSAARSMQS